MSAGNAFALYLLGPWIYGLILALLMLWIAPQSGILAVIVGAAYTIIITLVVGVYAQRGGRRVTGE